MWGPTKNLDPIGSVQFWRLLDTKQIIYIYILEDCYNYLKHNSIEVKVGKEGYTVEPKKWGIKDRAFKFYHT